VYPHTDKAVKKVQHHLDTTPKRRYASRCCVFLLLPDFQDVQNNRGLPVWLRSYGNAHIRNYFSQVLLRKLRQVDTCVRRQFASKIWQKGDSKVRILVAASGRASTLSE
jgi:hypothetical protein